MNYLSIAKSLAVISLLVGFLMIVPILTGIIYGEPYLPFTLLALGVMTLSGAVLLTLRHHQTQLGSREGMLVVSLVWLLLGIIGGLPFALYGCSSYVEGIFEAISGFTTTGATIISDIESLPNMILIWRSATHWFGGMGIIVFSIAILPYIGNGVMQLYKAESSGIGVEKLTPHIHDTALALWKVYCLLTVANIIALLLAGMNLFDAINHAFSTLGTGGFSTKNTSMAFYADNPLIIWLTTGFMLIAGISFLAHFKALSRDLSGYRTAETRLYLLIFCCFALGMSLAQWSRSAELPYLETLMHAAFTIASLMTTTGFASIDYEQWYDAAIVFALLTMVIGGCAGSTSGGIKVIRYVVLFRTLSVELKKIIHPRAVYPLQIGNKRLAPETITVVLGFFALYFLTTSALVLYLAVRGFDLWTAITASLAIVGSIGPGFGEVGPYDNYAFFAWYDKLVLSLGMIIGRLECYTFFVLFSRAFWSRF
ncbi:TrkH family potassium uptake protein [Chrysiogenes arsenatis]|uniref:TrkH family potassium uptake protein n=1 Tax=Chrysiogenes arsenatis TaxID=309797 RepID=UPI0004062836|nr:TrkH family potassium uptake protein [Chrysiogenes arsenatis]